MIMSYENALVPLAESFILPVSMAAKWRNTLMDGMFYDVSSLTDLEFFRLVRETNLEGSILVVHPRGRDGVRPVRKYSGHAELRDAPGGLLQRFAIAGVGSSDVGAAAFARTAADYYGEPVGAIVAGYGLADVLSEALGGWFFLGKSNRLMKAFHDRELAAADMLKRFEALIPGFDRANARAVAELLPCGPDSDTLIRLLLDGDRTIKTIVGHSKGCLSIAYALQVLAASGAKDALEKAKTIRCIMAGTVVELPKGFDNAAQFLGNLDRFGRMNSCGGVAYDPVPGAGHHLNTAINFHLNMHEILVRADCKRMLERHRQGSRAPATNSKTATRAAA